MKTRTEPKNDAFDKHCRAMIGMEDSDSKKNVQGIFVIAVTETSVRCHVQLPGVTPPQISGLLETIDKLKAKILGSALQQMLNPDLKN